MSDRKSHMIEDFDTQVDSVPDGFEIAVTPKSRHDVLCKTCRVSALGPAQL